MPELTGKIEKIARHDGGRYGMKVEGVWVNGFDLPDEILENQTIHVVYDEKPNPNGGNPYRNITSIEVVGGENQENPSPMGLVFRCPKCGYEHPIK
jgi:hypothetical protein